MLNKHAENLVLLARKPLLEVGRWRRALYAELGSVAREHAVRVVLRVRRSLGEVPCDVRAVLMRGARTPGVGRSRDCSASTGSRKGRPLKPQIRRSIGIPSTNHHPVRMDTK